MGLTKQQREHEHRERMKRFDAFASMGNSLIRYGVLGFIAWQGRRAIDSLAGKNTFADVKVLSDVRISDAVAAVFLGSCAIYTYRKVSFHKRKTAELSARNAKLEKAKDPRRSSSGLTPTGNTNPADED